MIQMTDVDYIEVYLIYGTTQISEKITIYKETCEYNNSHRVWWLNRRGGFDAYTFTGYETREIKAGSDSFVKQLDSDLETKDLGRKIIHVNANNEYELFSKSESEEVMTWLEELITSPLVYIDDLIPIILTDRNVMTNDPENKSVPTIKYTYANEIIIQ